MKGRWNSEYRISKIKAQTTENNVVSNKSVFFKSRFKKQKRNKEEGSKKKNSSYNRKSFQIVSNIKKLNGVQTFQV